MTSKAVKPAASLRLREPPSGVEESDSGWNGSGATVAGGSGGGMQLDDDELETVLEVAGGCCTMEMDELDTLFVGNTGTGEFEAIGARKVNEDKAAGAGGSSASFMVSSRCSG